MQQLSFHSIRAQHEIPNLCGSYAHYFSFAQRMTSQCLHATLLNKSADALSRNNLPLFFTINPQAQPQPTAVPDELLELVFNRNLLWTSPNWTNLFATILAHVLPPPHEPPMPQPSAMHFSSFCQAASVANPYPVEEQTLCRFVSYLGQQALKHHTINSYLSGIRFTQIQEGLDDPFSTKSMPLLEYVLAGIKHAQAKVGIPPKTRLPITPDILAHLQATWISIPGTYDGTMLLAAACTGFFGFLHAGEFTVPSDQAYDKEVHLNLNDLAIDSHTNPSVIQLSIVSFVSCPRDQELF